MSQETFPIIGQGVNIADPNFIRDLKHFVLAIIPELPFV